MRNYAISYTEAATVDLEAVYDYLSIKIDRAVATKIRRRIISDMKDLRTMPERAAPYAVEPWMTAGLRKYLVAESYLAFLLVDHAAQIVIIYRIFFASSNYDAVLATHAASVD